MSKAALLEHLATGLTEVCRCWAVARRDGRVLGFTDHDRTLEFEGIAFRPDSGMTAKAISQTTGLSVDNSEAMGVLSDPAISEADLRAGRFDGAEVRTWLVNWRDPEQRLLRFRGTIGEIRRGDGAFHAELRGLTEPLNQPLGRVYQTQCAAVLGDASCRFDLARAGYVADSVALAVEGGRVFRFAGLDGFAAGWFERGRLAVLSGAAEGLSGIVRTDRVAADGGRTIELWQAMNAPVAAGDQVRLTAGCDKRAQTCRLKFDNFLNFRGYPHIPGEDWLVSVPVRAGRNDGGSLNR